MPALARSSRGTVTCAVLSVLFSLSACAAPLRTPPPATDVELASLSPGGPAAAPQVQRRSSLERGGRSGDATAVQALLGASRYNDLRSGQQVQGTEGELVADISQLPTLGFAGHYRLSGRTIEFGLDGGLLYSWAGDRQSAYLGNGNTLIYVEQRLSLADLFFGAYGSARLGDAARVYLGAGPCMLWGYSEYEDQRGSESGSAFGLGGYVRGGIEYRLPDRAMLGLGVRSSATDLDFGGRVGTYDVDGWQVFLTYTVGM